MVYIFCVSVFFYSALCLRFTHVYFFSSSEATSSYKSLLSDKWEGDGWATAQECVQWQNILLNGSPLCLHQSESYQQHMSSSCIVHLTTLLILWLAWNKDFSQNCQCPVCKLLVIPQVRLLSLFPRIKTMRNVQTVILNINGLFFKIKY